jgi:hypothetical protein
VRIDGGLVLLKKTFIVGIQTEIKVLYVKKIFNLVFDKNILTISCVF